MIKQKWIVLKGQGINCENETTQALQVLNAEVRQCTMHELIEQPQILIKSQGLVLPGGFSYADDLGSGTVLSQMFKLFLAEQIFEFKEKNKIILGICNGFQAMVKMDLFNEGISEEKFAENEFDLVPNESGVFQNRWIKLKYNSRFSNSEFNQNFCWPIRHGEGRLITRLSEHELNSKIFLQYDESPHNGSVMETAGIMSKNGLIVGLMPHPEAAIYLRQSPFNLDKSSREFGSGYYFFKELMARI